MLECVLGAGGDPEIDQKGVSLEDFLEEGAAEQKGWDGGVKTSREGCSKPEAPAVAGGSVRNARWLSPLAGWRQLAEEAGKLAGSERQGQGQPSQVGSEEPRRMVEQSSTSKIQGLALVSIQDHTAGSSLRSSSGQGISILGTELAWSQDPPPTPSNQGKCAWLAQRGAWAPRDHCTLGPPSQLLRRRIGPLGPCWADIAVRRSGRPECPRGCPGCAHPGWGCSLLDSEEIYVPGSGQSANIHGHCGRAEPRAGSSLPRGRQGGGAREGASRESTRAPFSACQTVVVDSTTPKRVVDLGWGHPGQTPATV